MTVIIIINAHCKQMNVKISCAKAYYEWLLQAFQFLVYVVLLSDLFFYFPKQVVGMNISLLLSTFLLSSSSLQYVAVFTCTFCYAKVCQILIYFLIMSPFR